MIRLDRRRPLPGTVELLVSGALEGDAVPVLGDAIADDLTHDSAVMLNLSGVVTADLSGCLALLDWMAAGTRITDCPAFLRQWIRAERRSRFRDGSRIRGRSTRTPMRRSVPFAVLVCLLATLPAWADPPPAGLALSFADARARMLAANETARAADEDVAERHEERSAAKGFYWPRVEPHAQATHLNDDVILDLDPIRDVINGLHRLPATLLPSFESTFQKQDFWLTSLSVTWPLYTGGKVQAANKAAALQVTDAEQARRQTTGALSSELVRRCLRCASRCGHAMSGRASSRGSTRTSRTPPPSSARARSRASNACTPRWRAAMPSGRCVGRPRRGAGANRPGEPAGVGRAD